MGLQTDVLIVGGGPAGLAAAIALRQRGFDCVLVEAQALRDGGIDKACGEGLMPDTLAALQTLGVMVRPEDGACFRGIRFVNPTHRVEAEFPDGVGIGVRRPRLHQLLRERAEAVGATLRWGTQVQLGDALTDRQTAMVGGQRLRFQWLVGADGHASTVRRWAGMDRLRRESVRYGTRVHYQVRPWTDCVEVHWGPGGQYYCTPVGPECVGVALIARDAAMLRHGAMAGFAELAARLKGAEVVSQQRGGLSVSRRYARVAAGCVALVGDASGAVDSITGEGLGIAFRQASALAEAVEAGSLAHYAAEHSRMMRLPRVMAQMLLMMDRWPTVEQRALRMLAERPQLLSELLSVHVGHKSPVGFAVRRGAAMGWSLLARA